MRFFVRSGRWVTRWLAPSRVVALTAFAGAENRLKTEHAGFQVHMDKPIDPPQLIDAINTLIKIKKAGKR
jgi:CheY-like chemotaxis protein